MIRILSLTLVGALAVTGCDGSDVPRLAPDALSAAQAAFEEERDLRRVWARAGDYANPSPDGRLVTFVDWSTGDVAVHDVVTGQDRRITDKGTWTEDGSWAEEPIFSPDGRSVAYTYGNVAAPGMSWRYELRVVGLDDPTPRMVMALDPRDQWIVATDWSSTAGIAVEVNHGPNADFTTDLSIVDPVSGAVRVIRTTPKAGPHPHDGTFSPDGRFLAYRLGGQLHIATTDGARDTSFDLPVRWVLGWTKDERLLVHASLHNQTGIWSVPVRNGRVAGEPSLVRGGLSAFLPGHLANAGYYFVVPVDAPRIYAATIDIASGKLLSPPSALTTAIDGSARLAAWSPDGRTLAYVLSDDINRVLRIMVRVAEGDQARELATIPAGQIREMTWSPDGDSLLLTVANQEGLKTVRVDLRRGDVTPVELPSRGHLVFAPDGRMVFARGDGQSGGGIFVRDPATGREHSLLTLQGGSTRAFSVSPDGRQVAIVVPPDEPRGAIRVVLVPIEGGTPREIARVEYPMHFERGVAIWSPDGREVLVQRGGWEGERHEIVALPVDGGAPRVLMPAEQMRSLSLTADGRRLAYVGGEARRELWVLDDLTPQ